jgi:hypothetical protein
LKTLGSFEEQLAQGILQWSFANVTQYGISDERLTRTRLGAYQSSDKFGLRLRFAISTLYWFDGDFVEAVLGKLSSRWKTRWGAGSSTGMHVSSGGTSVLIIGGGIDTNNWLGSRRSEKHLNLLTSSKCSLLVSPWAVRFLHLPRDSATSLSHPKMPWSNNNRIARVAQSRLERCLQFSSSCRWSLNASHNHREGLYCIYTGRWRPSIPSQFKMIHYHTAKSNQAA